MYEHQRQAGATASCLYAEERSKVLPSSRLVLVLLKTRASIAATISKECGCGFSNACTV